MTTRLPNKTNIDSNNKNEEDNCQILYTKKLRALKSRIYRDRERRRQESILKKLYQLERENRKLKDENCKLKEENKKLKETLQKIHDEKNSENTSNFRTKEQPSKKQLPVHESFFQRVQKKPNQFQKLVKLQFYQFENVLKKVAEPLSKLTATGQIRQRTTLKPPTISYGCQLFITLFWLRQYPIDETMAAIFNLDKRQLHRILVNNLQILQQVLQSKIEWPTDTEFQQYLNQFQGYLNGNFRGLVCVVDGTEIRVSRPSDENRNKEESTQKRRSSFLSMFSLFVF